MSKTQILIATQKISLKKELAKNFHYFGYPVKAVDTLDELLGLIKNKNTAEIFSAIIIDMSFCTQENISQMTFIRPAAPLIFITEKDSQAIRLAALRAGGQTLLTFPIDFNALLEKIELLSPTSKQSHPFKVSLIEPSLTQAPIIRDLLTDAGMTVEVLNALNEINQQLADFGPELILMALEMPGCSGMELAAILRQQEVYATVPILFFSSKQDIIKHLEVLSLEGDGILTLPIQNQHWLHTITTHVMRARHLGSKIILDSLTGLLNHSRILEQLNVEISRAQRDQSSLSFVMLDIDHFKNINDTYGHLTGDSILKKLASILKNRLRKSDSVGRYGGEEFAMIFPKSEAKAIYLLLEDIKNNFAELTPTVTFSAGIATFSPTLKTVSELVQAADKALYKAKDQGRNKIVIAD